MATDLTKQQREDRKKAIQKVRDYYPLLKGSGDDFIMTMTPGMVEFAECAIRTERERDEAVRLIEWIRSMKIVEQMDRIDAFLAAHPANGGQDE
jgi:vacuolar-type H+-ATPase subunit D/Vma8